MFWLQVKSIFLKNISIFVALAILILSLTIYFPSLGQESRLTERRGMLEKESLQLSQEVERATLLREDLTIKTYGLDSQIEAWEERTSILKGYLVEAKNE